MDEQCPIQSQSGNGTEATLPTTPFLKIQIKNPMMTADTTNSTVTKARQIKIGSAPHKHKMYTFQEDHTELRKIKVAKVLQKSEAATSSRNQEPRRIKVAKTLQKPAPEAKTSSPVEEKAPQKMHRVGSNLLSSGQVTPEEVRSNLISELKATFRSGADHSRINKWEKAIEPLYLALPKNTHGNLGHAAARYVLHRALVRQHGWSIQGLEPKNASSATLKEWVPEYLLNAIEQLVGTEGITSQELAVLAATFEDLVHKEAIARLRDVYEVKGLAIENPIKRDVAEDIVATYMTVYTADLPSSVPKTVQSAVALNLDLEDNTKKWLRKVQSDVTGSQMLLNGASKELNFKTTARVVEEIGERYSDFNDFECRALKEILVGQESHSHPGMLRLSDFYSARTSNETYSQYNPYWSFNEKPDQLRTLGALDESGSEPHVIIPNYISSVANCIPVSGFYRVCCRSECESLMGNLEQKLKSPAAKPDTIAKAVGDIPTDVVGAPVKLSPSSLNLLEGIAATSDGLVHLHSREFVQWMHHVFPRECPKGHDGYSEDPQTPDEWLKEFGADNAKTSKDEMSRHVEASAAQMLSPQHVSGPPVLVKHRRISPFTHLKNALFLQAEREEEEDLSLLQQVLETHATQGFEAEEPLPCVDTLEAAEEPMPWDPQECMEEMFTDPQIQAPRKLKVQPITKDVQPSTEDVIEMMHGPEQQTLTQKLSLRALLEEPEKVAGIVHGPEEQPLTQKKLSLKAILDSTADIKPKEALEADVLWDVYNEPAQSYWEREDHARQELDKAELIEVPTVPPQAADDFSLPRSSSPTLEEAFISSFHQYSALLVLAVFLTLVVLFQSASSKPRLDKIYSPYSKRDEAHQEELLRAAAFSCTRQQSALRRSFHVSNDMV